MNSMKQHLPEVDMDRLSFVLNIREAYALGQLSLEEARTQLRTRVARLAPWEIALAEQELKVIEDDECRKENIQQMLELFEGLLDTTRPELPADHPISYYYRENDEMRRHLRAIEDLVQYPVIRNQWFELYDLLAQWRTHLARKQNQLYPVLERKGFDRPTTTMWLLDDFVRDELRQARTLLEEGREEEFIALQATIVADVLDLMDKEETVLYPTALAMITPEEYEDMKSGDREIGFAWLEGVPHRQTQSAETAGRAGAETAGFAAELGALLSKYGLSTGAGARGQLLDVTTGKLTLEQINLIYQHLPIDISFVDEQELVCFYSDTNHRIFPRSKNVIGRDVKNCHPRTSVHLVQEIIEKFRSGEQDSVDFWINKPGLFIYIYYVAVRDAEGRFRGVLEMMQDCTRIRDLQDSRTLLLWSQDTHGASRPKPGAEPPAEEPQPHPTETQTEAAPAAEASAPGQSLTIDLTPETRLRDLLEQYPGLRKELPRIDSAFRMLNSPLARIIIPRADVRMMSERSGVPLERLIEELRQLIAEQQARS